ncbi:MAG: hypothetical protein Q9227_004154 [Pyrenula ochraceoflavens]
MSWPARMLLLRDKRDAHKRQKKGNKKARLLSSTEQKIQTALEVDGFYRVLSRHGARAPTAGKAADYNATITKIQTSVPSSSFKGPYAFLPNYEYDLGADELTAFGALEMLESGERFYSLYPDLTRSNTPFIRSAGQARVVDSATSFAQGFGSARASDPAATDHTSPSISVIIPEDDPDSPNPLAHNLCTAFEKDRKRNEPQSTFASLFVPPIRSRFTSALQYPSTASPLTNSDIINLMDLCPYETVAMPPSLHQPTTGASNYSPFCNLFTTAEWHQYAYYQSLGKYYTYGPGALPLGPTQGVGFANELIARLTNSPVDDHTSTDPKLDSDPATFPLGRKLYADFSHDNDMTAIFSALGLYNATPPLPTHTIQTPKVSRGYSAGWTVPFAARAYFERMTCSDTGGSAVQMVRSIVNDRVMNMGFCGADRHGRCRLEDFVGALGFVKMGGHWDLCFE